MSTMTPMQQAKARFVLKNVFFASLVMSTDIKASDKCKTAATNMVDIIYNEKFINDLGDPDVVMFVLAHEVMHIVFKHGLRKGHRDHQRWNKACDYAINLMLKKEGFTLWAHCLIDVAFDGMSAEQIYDILAKEDEEGRGRGGDDGIGEDLIEPDEPMSPDEIAEIEQQITQKVAAAATQARLAGQMSGEIERLVNGILNPAVSWQEQLKEYMTELVNADENWSRRNRRFFNVVLPTMLSEAMGELTWIIDSSGSISMEELEVTASELMYLAETVKPTQIRVVWCDAQVAGEQVFEQGEDIKLVMKGGGGTDMRVALSHVTQYDPMVVIMSTDGDTPWGDAPDYPLIILMSTNHDAPFGRIIHVTSQR